MARKKTGVMGSMRNRVWAGVVSALTATGGSIVAYYWNELTGESPQAPATEAAKKAIAVLGTLTSHTKQKVSTCDLLGADVTETDNRISVVSVRLGTPGAILGLVEGDVIESVDHHRIDSPEILEASLARGRPFFGTVVRVKRGESTLFGEVYPSRDGLLVVQRPLAQ